MSAPGESTTEEPRNDLVDDALMRRLERSEARLVNAVLPGRQNHFGTFGGNLIMALMEEVAWVSATRFTRMDMITAGSEAVRFEKPVPAGTILEVVARVESVGRTSVTARVEVFAEDIHSDRRDRTAHGLFTLVALDANGRPTRIEPAGD